MNKIINYPGISITGFKENNIPEFKIQLVVHNKNISDKAILAFKIAFFKNIDTIMDKYSILNMQEEPLSDLPLNEYYACIEKHAEDMKLEYELYLTVYDEKCQDQNFYIFITFAIEISEEIDI